MKQIIKNEYYELGYDAEKNWIYWTMKGFWRNMGVAPDFKKDWESALNCALEPFKIYADLSSLKTMPEDVRKANDEMQQYLMQNGCVKVSCLIEDPLTKMSLNEVIKNSGMDKMVQYFSKDESEEANVWLQK